MLVYVYMCKMNLVINKFELGSLFIFFFVELYYRVKCDCLLGYL